MAALNDIYPGLGAIVAIVLAFVWLEVKRRELKAEETRKAEEEARVYSYTEASWARKRLERMVVERRRRDPNEPPSEEEEKIARKLLEFEEWREQFNIYKKRPLDLKILTVTDLPPEGAADGDARSLPGRPVRPDAG